MDEELYAAVCTEIRLAMTLAGNMSIAELARRIGVRRETLSEHLAGKTKNGMPLIETLRIAEVLGVSAEELMRRAMTRVREG